MDETGRSPVILVLAPNWLGDVVMASPLLSRLAAARDGSGRGPAVQLAVRRAWAPLFAGDPRLAAVVEVERPGRHAGVRGLGRLAAQLRRVGADAVVLGPPSLRAALVARLAGVPARIGYRGDGRGFLLSAALRRPIRGARHHGDELLDLGDRALAACGLKPGDPDRERGWGLLPGCTASPAADPGPGPPLWVLAPGTTYGEAKVWPVANAARFADLAVGTRGVRLVLLGDSGAAGFAAALRERCAGPWRPGTAGPAGIVDLVGRTTVAEAAALLRRAEAFVGNDSGLMHLAGALGVPTVGLFGSTDPAWTAPLGPRVRTLAADGFPCRPCFRRTCNQERFCLETIAAEAVLEAVDALVAAARKEMP
ncbi:MAG: glycosyltransferase family 9 protein [Candidatus Krumholzibacteriia bacterium]